MKTWLEEYLYQCTIYEGERIAAKSGIEDICKKILDELRTNEGLEPFFKNYIFELIKSLGVEL